MNPLEKLIDIVDKQADTIKNINKSIDHLTQAIIQLQDRVKDLESKRWMQLVLAVPQKVLPLTDERLFSLRNRQGEILFNN